MRCNTSRKVIGAFDAMRRFVDCVRPPRSTRSPACQPSREAAVTSAMAGSWLTLMGGGSVRVRRASDRSLPGLGASAGGSADEDAADPDPTLTGNKRLVTGGVAKSESTDLLRDRDAEVDGDVVRGIALAAQRSRRDCELPPAGKLGQIDGCHQATECKSPRPLPGV